MLEENLTLYDLLDLHPDASPQEIRDAYLRTKTTYNRDSVVLYTLLSSEEREETLKRIEEAYQILSDPDQRRDYDRNHGLFNSYENPFSGGNIARPAHIIPFDRNSTLSASLESENLLIPPKTDFKPAPNPDPTQGSNESFSLFLTPVPVTGLVPGQGNEPLTTSSTPLQPAKQTPAPTRETSLIPSAPPIQNSRAQTHPSPSHPLKLEAGLLLEIESQNEWQGSLLRKVREGYQISLEEMSAITKVTKTYLVALEEENFSKLPAAVYIRGFIVQIAKVLKLPFEKVALSYLTRVSLARKNEGN